MNNAIVQILWISVTTGTLAASAPPIGSQTPAGRTVEARGDVLGTPPGSVEVALAAGDTLVLDHLIATGRASLARLAIGRGGSLSLGQDTRLRLDQERIDAATGLTQSTFSLLLGRLELALGRLFQGELTIETPTATLGIKGTVVRIFVDADGRTVVAVLEGLVEVTSRAGGTVRPSAGFFTVVEPGAPPMPPAPFDLRASALAAGARGPDFVVPGEQVLIDSPLGRRQLDTISPGRLVNCPPETTGCE
jgi:ferric-dicitrate binding protein FerR (iron transport regulator)